MNLRHSTISALSALLVSSSFSLAEPKPEIIAQASDGLKNPFGITFDSKQNTYIVEYEGGRIFRIPPKGKLEYFSGKPEEGFAGDGGPAKDAGF